MAKLSSLFRVLKQKPSGFSLVEMMIAVGLLGIVGLTTTTLVTTAVQTRNEFERASGRNQLIQQIQSGARNPALLRASLNANIPCLAAPALPCAAQPETDFALVESLGAGAQTLTIVPQRIYSASGDRQCSGNGVKECAIAAWTKYSVVCPGRGAGVGCPLNQALLSVSFFVGINPALANVGKTNRFQPVQGNHVLAMTDLVSEAGSNSAIRDLATIDAANIRSCGVGQAMIGLDANGEPMCRALRNICTRGQVFTGFTRQADGSFTTNCQSIVCPAGQVLRGVDPVSGTPTCQQINPSNIECDPMSGGAPNTGTSQFMVGIQGGGGYATPVCRRKTCQRGEISACWINGNIQCVNTSSFIPTCSGCSPPPAGQPTAPASETTYYDSATVPLGYDGFPFISNWYNGEPIQGRRMTYRNWGQGQTNDPWDNNVIYDTRGSGQTIGCDFDAGFEGGSPQNMTVTHNWARLVSVGTYVPNDPNDFVGWCYLNRYPDVAAVPMYASNPYAHWSAYGQGEGRIPGCDPQSPNPYPDGIIRYWVGVSEQCTVTYNAGSNQATASCPSGNGDNACYGNYFGPTTPGTEACHRYDGWNIRAACNFKYNKNPILCGGSNP